MRWKSQIQFNCYVSTIGLILKYIECHYHGPLENMKEKSLGHLMCFSVCEVVIYGNLNTLMPVYLRMRADCFS